jgi:hypothetical protein
MIAMVAMTIWNTLMSASIPFWTKFFWLTLSLFSAQVPIFQTTIVSDLGPNSGAFENIHSQYKHYFLSLSVRRLRLP